MSSNNAQPSEMKCAIHTKPKADRVAKVLSLIQVVGETRQPSTRKGAKGAKLATKGAAGAKE